MLTKGFVPAISKKSKNESLWTPPVLMQTCKASYPIDTITVPLLSLPVPPPQEPLLIVQLPKEEEIPLSSVCPRKIKCTHYTVNFKIAALKKVDEILNSDPRKSLL